MGDRTATAHGVTARYVETDHERRLMFESDDARAVIAQNLDGYAMLSVREHEDGIELERYYGLEMALDHVGEMLGVDARQLPVPEVAADLGM